MIKMSEKQNHLVRVNVYQCHDLVAKDSNGLSDPYLQVRFCGTSPLTYRSEHIKPEPTDGPDNRSREQKYGIVETNLTRKKKETLYPTYYETFDFRVTMTPEKEFMPMVTFQAFDQDDFTSERLGIAHYNLSNAMTSLDPATVPYKDPEWVYFFDKQPGDGQVDIH